MAEADEVPPHHDFFAQRLSADEENAGSLAARDQGQGPVADGQVREVVRRDRLPVQGKVARVHEQAVFEGHICCKRQLRPRFEQELGTEQGRVGGDGRDGPGECAQEDAHGPAVSADRLRTVVLKSGRHVACRVRQRHPQLRAVQDGGVRGGKFRMADAAAGGHEVHFTGPHRCVEAGRIPVFDFACEQPADGLKPGVRVARDFHAAGIADLVRAVVVQEAPRPDEAALALRKGAPHIHRAGAAQRDLPRNQEFDAGAGPVRFAKDFLGRDFGIAHDDSLASRGPRVSLRHTAWTSRTGPHIQAERRNGGSAPPGRWTRIWFTPVMPASKPSALAAM
ncbi:hypothetical protein SRABI128_06406 [Microbacterium sp. Bi128]|nr:hypothetical protein SRABI128_06406 [Microbacterium sp. Bi128]